MKNLIYFFILILFSCNSKRQESIDTNINSELTIINGIDSSVVSDKNLKDLIPKAYAGTISIKIEKKKHPVLNLSSAILLILISLAHLIYGEKKQIPDLKKLTSDSIHIGSMRIMIVQGGLLILFAGILHLFVALDLLLLQGLARFIPLTLVLINFVSALFITLIFHREIFKITIPQFVIFVVIIILQVLAL